jgi:hypothetical protein
VLVDVHQVHRYHLARRYRHRLIIAGHGRRDRRGGAVPRLRDGAHRASWNAVETLRHVARRVPAATTKSGDRAMPSQTTLIVTGPRGPATGPAMVFVTSREPEPIRTCR